MDLIRDGARVLFRGARKGSRGMAGLGAALVAVGWVRSLYRSDRELIYSRTLKKGDALRIRLLGPDDSVSGDLEIDG